jgi:hypothetical protein
VRLGVPDTRDDPAVYESDTDPLPAVATTPVGASGTNQLPEIIELLDAPELLATARVTPTPQVSALQLVSTGAVRASQLIPSDEVATRLAPSLASAMKNP